MLHVRDNLALQRTPELYPAGHAGPHTGRSASTRPDRRVSQFTVLVLLLYLLFLVLLVMACLSEVLPPMIEML